MHSWVLLCLQPSVTMWYTLCVPPITRWTTFKWEVSTLKSGLVCSLHAEKTLPLQLTRVQCFLKPIMFHASIYWYYVNSGIQWVDLYLLHHLRIQHPLVVCRLLLCIQTKARIHVFQTGTSSAEITLRLIANCCSVAKWFANRIPCWLCKKMPGCYVLCSRSGQEGFPDHHCEVSSVCATCLEVLLRSDEQNSRWPCGITWKKSTDSTGRKKLH